MSRVKIAIAGFGAIGKRHAEFVLANPECALVGVCAQTDRSKDEAARLGVPLFTDFSRMLSETKPDGVIDATPTPQHMRIGVECAERGIDLLVEKPIAHSIADAKQLIDAARRAGIKLLVGHHRRHNPLYQRVRDLISQGDLGTLRMVVCQWTALKPDVYYQIQWRTEPGQGPLPTNLIHDIDALRYICGEIESVSAFTSSEARKFPFTDTLSATLRFQSGALGVIAMSDSVASPWAFEITAGEDPGFPRNCECFLRLMGSEGSLAFPQMEYWRHAQAPQSGWRGPLQRTTISVKAQDPLERQLAHFCDVIRRKAEPMITGEDALMNLAVAISLDMAGKTKCAVSPRSLIHTET